jgi:dihydrofolate synthase/folylpolyglutamate synthase
MLAVLDALGHPERAFRSALVVGTNGKGSTAALLAGVLSRHGIRVGLYTSPHLVRVEERIAVDGAPISQDELLPLISGLAGFPQLSYFETLTAAAFVHFAASGVDVAVLEAGLGGRWDATNAGAQDVSLLTNVGTDHQSWLGATRREIAAEKAAALRGREAIVGAWDDEVAPVIRAAADPATPISLAADWATVNAGAAAGTVEFAVGDVRGAAELPLAGEHQRANLALALAGAAALARHGAAPPLRAEAVAAGVAAVRWRGRLQRVEWRGRTLLLDGAHNREAVAALAAALDAMGLSGRIDLLFSCLDDKPLAAMAELLRPRVDRVTVAPIASPRATSPADLAREFPGCTIRESIAAALAAVPEGATVLVTGSLRLVGEAITAIGATEGG